jgi:hypothetical protein
MPTTGMSYPRRKTKSREHTCRKCGCTDSRACSGGCFWADKKKTLCSNCAPHWLVQRALAYINFR